MSEDASLGFTTLDCNHGTQDEDVCVCDQGWTSSGVDSNDQEHWCDVREGKRLFDTGPIELGYLQEIATIIVSSTSSLRTPAIRTYISISITCVLCLKYRAQGLLVLNIVLLVGWPLLVYCLGCRGKRNSTK